jgi:hypothetical protein
VLNFVLGINLFSDRADTKCPLFGFIPIRTGVVITAKYSMYFAIHTKNNFSHANTFIG